MSGELACRTLSKIDENSFKSTNAILPNPVMITSVTNISYFILTVYLSFYTIYSNQK